MSDLVEEYEILEEVGKTIPDFPNYEVTNFGRVFNIRTGREMALSPTEHGDLTVGIVRDHHQYRFSVKCLVARAFVEGENALFDTPIQLDGDKHNLFAENIVWRPRWFAWRYSRQFMNMPSWCFYGPLVDRISGEQFRNYVDAAMINGLLIADIKESIFNNRLTFPTHQKFAYVI